MLDLVHVPYSTIQKIHHQCDSPLGEFSGQDNETLVFCPLEVVDDEFDRIYIKGFWYMSESGTLVHRELMWQTRDENESQVPRVTRSCDNGMIQPS